MKGIFTRIKFLSFLLLFPLLSYSQGTVSSVASAPTNAFYKAGQTVTITVTFSTNVDVHGAGAGNQPSLLLNNGVTVLYTGSDLNNVGTMDFTYTVSATEDVAPLNYNATSSLTTPGTSTIIKHSGTAMTLTLPATGSGNALGNSNVTIDTTVPTLTLTLPGTNAFVKNANVTYTRSQALSSGTITFTRTGGAADGAAHVQTLTGTELTANQTNHTLNNPPTLVDGAIYTVSIDGSDLAGNAATTVSTTNVTFDTSGPTLTLTSPAASTLVKNTQVSYTITEDLSAGTITWARTGGTADGASHIQNLSGTELTADQTNHTLNSPPTLVSGAIYTVTFAGTDLAGNAGTPDANTLVTFDNVAPTLTLTAPANNSFVNDAQVTYTRNENLASGTITWTQTGGTADGTSPHIQSLSGTELTANQTNHTLNSPPVLVDGAIYTVSFDGVDAAGNVSTTVSRTNVTFDTSGPTPTLTQPATGSRVNSGKVTYTRSENLSAGTITWTRTGGTADGASHIQNLSGTELTVDQSNHTLNNPPTLVNGTIYTVTFAATDVAGNAGTPASTTNVTFDNALPVLTLTAPATGSTVGNTNVTYTLNENLLSGTITWARTGGTADGASHIQNLTGTELTANQTNHTLNSPPTLVSGAIYTVTFAGTDLAGNVGTPAARTGVTYDTTPPTLTLTLPGTNAFVNHARVTYTRNENLQSGTITWTQTGGSADGTSPHIQALSGGELTGNQTNHTLTSPPTLVDGAVYTVTFAGTDVAGNPGTPVSTTNVTYDITPPAIAGVPCYDPHGNSAETIDILFTETLGLTNGASVSQQGSGGKGFGENENNPASAVYTSAGNKITLTSAANHDFHSTGKIGYIPAAALPVIDLAGNEMASTGGNVVTIQSCTVPLLASSMVLFPNGGAPESIYFEIDQQLTIATGTAVTGLSVSSGSIGSAIYTFSGGVAFVTITSGANGDFTGATTVSYTGTGNLTNSSGSMLAFLTEKILLTPVTISSNNANTSWAKAGNTVTVGFTLNKAISAIPTATINGAAATITGAGLTIGSVYTASLVTSGATVEGVMTFDIAVNEASGRSTDVLATLDGTSVTFDKTAPTVPTVTIISNNGTNTAFAKPGDVVTVAYAPADNLGTVSLTAATIDLLPATTSTLASSTLNTTAADNNGIMPFSITFSDQAGNLKTVTATTNASTVTFDKVAPTVNTISVVGANLNGIGSSNGTSLTTLTYTVAFLENVTGLTMGDFSLTPSGYAGNASFPLVGGSVTGLSGGPLTYTVTATLITGTGSLRLDFNASASVIDAAGNANVAAFSGGQSYQEVLQQPTNNATLLGASAPSFTSIKLDWTNPILGVLPTHFLVVGKLTGTGSYPGVSDGNFFASPDANFNDANGGSAIVDLTGGYTLTSSIIIPGLISGQHYDFLVYPYTLSPNNLTDNVNYLTTGTPTVSLTVPTANVGVVLAGTTAAPATISSLQTSNGAVNFSFKVQDDAGTSADNAPTMFNQLVIGDGGSSTAPNWSTVILSATLIDITQNPGPGINATTIGSNSITFTTGLTTTPGGVGYVAEDATKEYQLLIALKSPLPTNVDNKLFDFLVNNASFSFIAGSSTLAASQSQNTGSASNKVTVIATALRFTTQPSPANGLNNPNVAPFVLLNLLTNPVVEAVDGNFNRDLDIDGANGHSVNVTNTAGIAMDPGNVTTLSLGITQGVVTFPVGFQYRDKGDGTLLVTKVGPGAALTSNAGAGFLVCTPLNVSYSKTSTISAGTGVATISSLNASDTVFRFTIKDDAGSLGDGSPTRISTIVIGQGTGNTFGTWTDVIASASLTDDNSPTANTIAGVVHGTDITFSGISTAVNAIGYIADNGTKVYKLRVVYQNPLLAGLQATADNKHLVFSVSQGAGLVDIAQSSFIANSETADSGPGNGLFQVIATQYVITTAPLASQNYDAVVTPQPVLKAEDAKGNVDLNYSLMPTITSTTTLANNTTSTTNGVITINGANLKFTSVGGGAEGDVAQLTFSDGTISTATGNITLHYSGNSDIIQDNLFGYPSAIAYQANQSVGPLTSGNSLALEQFLLRDGGGSADADGTDTKLTSITFDITNWQNLRQLALFDGATPLKELTVAPNITVQTPTVGRITFSGFTFTATDVGLTKALTLRATFQQNVTDGQVISFAVNKVVASPTSSSQFANTTPTGIQTIAVAPQNQIAVVATHLTFVLPGTPPNQASLYAPYTNVLIQAQDVAPFNNLDKDYVGQVSTFTNPALNRIMANGPVPGATNFSGGIINFATTFPNFQYQSGNDGDDVHLFMSTSTGLSGTSNAITLQTATDSYIYFDMSSASARIPYINYIPGPTTAASFALGKLVLSDGNGQNYQTNGTHATAQDVDGAPTAINDVTISLTNAADISAIGIYDSLNNKIADAPIVSGSVTFTGLGGGFPNYQYGAPDNKTYPFTIRATFVNNPTSDQDLITMQVTAVTLATGGSKFFSPVGGGVAGVQGPGNLGDQSAAGYNQLDVIATKLVFTQQPPRYAGILEEVPHGLSTLTTVKAEDNNGKVDLDFDAVTKGTVTSAAGLPISQFDFNDGVLDLSSLQYSGTGDGTLTVKSTIGLPPSVAAPTQIVSSAVDVIDVTTGIALSSQIATTNLAGGSINKFIFGVTFSATHVVSGPDHPTLQSFKILFTNPATNPFTNARVFESSNSPNFGGPNVTTLNGKVSMTPDSVTVYFYTPRSMVDPITGNPKDLTYYLQVDVAGGASGSTPTVQPYVLDNGFNAPDGSYPNIVISQGSIHANTSGQVYSFASIFPPTLTSSYPASGQLNVDVSQPTIFLNFSVPVKSFDGQIRLYDQAAGTFTTLTTPDGTNNLVNPIRFTITTPLSPNKVYYVTIAPGVAPGSVTTGTGLSDQAGNLFGGISYSGTLYFKTANPLPPLLLTTPPVGTSAPSITNISATSATLNATFDQPGKAYFLVLPSGTATPTPDQIKQVGIPHPLAKAKGSFNINQINPISQFGIIDPTSISPISTLTVGAAYDVWISAESYSEFSGSTTPSPVTVKSIPVLSPLHFGSSAKVPKTGTISTLVSSDSVKGVGTSFTTELVVGRSIFNGGTFIGTIASIASATSLRLTTNASVAVTNSAFLGSGFELGASGPTMTFTVPTPSGSTITLNNPSISICTNSYQTLNLPITISERSANNFASAGLQVINLVLPAGFQFDVTMNGSTPKYGTLTRTGADFSILQPAQPLKFLGNSILQVSFNNTASTSIDNIIISGLRVQAFTSTNGNIIRLGGTGLLSIPDGTSFAALSANDAAGIPFTNDYSVITFNNNQVTTIPDNFAGGSVTLTPLPPAGDFGPSTFSGQGVNVNKLSLSAVTLGNPFFISVTHTDNNGCVSTSPTQYTVYDHNTAIAILNSGFSNVSGVAQCIPNVNFPNPAPVGGVNKYKIFFDNLPAYYMDSLKADVPAAVRKAQFLNPSLPHQIIDSAVWRPLIQNHLLVLGPTDNAHDGSSPATSLPAGLHEVKFSSGSLTGLPDSTKWFNPHNPSSNPFPGVLSPPGKYYSDYQFDVSTILNANSILPSIPDPYSYFVSSLTSQNHIYYRGGSLGIVELTGKFQSIANAAVEIPLIQNIEFFLPAIPLVEVGQGNMVNTTTSGISVYCQAGGPLAINGFPAASPGSSVGQFVVVDSLTNVVIYDAFVQPAIIGQSNVANIYTLTLAAPLKSAVTTSDWVTITGSNHDGTYAITAVTSPSVFSINVPLPTGAFTFTGGGRAITGGFLDNGNGTASLDPSKILNNYNPIKIIYTYKENISPCQSSSTRTIQIVKNPTALFTFQTEQISPGVYPANAPTNQSFCVGYNIDFDGSTSLNVTGTGATNDKTNFAWTFNDPTGKDSTNVLPTVPHKYGIAKATPYDVVLNVSSYWGCPSAPNPQQVTIGDIPVVDFTFYDSIVACPSCGVAKEKFKSTATVTGAGVSIDKWSWDFRYYSNGIATPNIDTLFRRYDSIHHYYAAPGIYNVKHAAQSNLFCANSATRNLVILPHVTTSANATYLQPFNDDGEWQVYDGRNSKVPTVRFATSNATPPSWQWGQPSGKPTMQQLVTNGDTAPNNTLWVTSLTGTYKQDEHSALYSPVFDIFNLNRPMVSFNTFAELGSDAVVLQFSVDSLNVADSTKVWTPLGSFLSGTNISSGVDWFNAQSLGVSPGDQPLNPLGWSDRGGSVKNWLQSKHSLDTLVKADTKNHGRRVYFRFALASSASSTPLEGFAIDNFRLGNRTRTVLVENFKNTGNTNGSEKSEAASLAAFNTNIIGTELIKLNYDVGFPGTDPFNQDNAADPSARALYYGINSTPLARLDGKNEVAPVEAPFSTWGKHYYDLRSLQLAQAKIMILPNTGNVNDSLPSLITQNGEFKFKVVVIPIDTLQPTTILQVAIVEDTISLASLSISQDKRDLINAGSQEQAFQYVVKKLLPNAAGTRFNTKYDSVNVPPPFEFEFVPDPSRFYGPTVGNLSIVAFLQDADTKEVWQTEAVRGLDNPVVTTTGLAINSEHVNIYPNPASSQFVIELPEAPKQPVNLKMVDQVGKLVHESTMEAGMKSKTVATRDLAEGIYILQIDGGNGNIVRSKIMVIHTQ